jgi:hypothetical protein
MTAEKRDQSASNTSGTGKKDKFPQTRAWALDWDLAAPVQFDSPDGLRPQVQSEPDKGNSEWEKFPQPRGWSLEWDGCSMAAVPAYQFQKRYAPGPPAESTTGGE